MKLTLDIPNDLVDLYASQAADVHKAMVERLKRFSAVTPDDRAILISGDERRRLEAAFQCPIDNGEQLYKAVKNLGSVRIGPVERVLTVDEILRVQDQATFHGWTEADFLKHTVDEALDYVFERM